jgi:hypothetical protein
MDAARQEGRSAMTIAKKKTAKKKTAKKPAKKKTAKKTAKKPSPPKYGIGGGN